MVRSVFSRIVLAAVPSIVAGCSLSPNDAAGAAEIPSTGEESVAVAEQALDTATSLDITTVSQGGRGGVHAHHCYLAACSTVFNYLTRKPVTMDDAWVRTGQQMPATDRVRTTLTRLGLSSQMGYMAAVTYTASASQLAAIGTSIANRWPVILGIGPNGTSAASIGHYIVIGGVDKTVSPSKFQLLDPWNAPVNDRGVLVPVPAQGVAVPGLRAARTWVALEVYFAKNYKTKRP